MKKIIFISFALITILATSCTQDFSDPTVLSGTTWRCSDANIVGGAEYFDLRFTSINTVEVWVKLKSESVQKFGDPVSYSINDKTITIAPSVLGETLVGVIKNKTMTFAQNGIVAIFIKQ